jgi:hypothetical protein
MNQSKLGPTISRYGLIGGLILSLIFLATSILGLAATGQTMIGLGIGLINFGVLLTVIILSIRTQRDQVQGGFITLGESILVGTGALVLAGLISTVVSLVYTNFIDPEYMSRIMEKAEEQWEAAGMSEEQIEAAKGYTQISKNPLLISAITLACYGIGGAFISMIVGLIMKNEKPELG